MPFFPDNSLLLCFPRVRCTAECRKENKERRCVPLYQVAWETRGYSLSLCRWEGQGLREVKCLFKVFYQWLQEDTRGAWAGHSGASSAITQISEGCWSLCTHKSQMSKIAQGPSLEKEDCVGLFQIVVESDWSQNVGWWFPYQFHISPHEIQAQGEKETSLEALLMTPLVPYPRYAYAGYYLDQVG